MNHCALLGTAAGILALGCACCVAQQKDRAAVVDLHTQAGIPPEVGRMVSDLLRSHYEKTGQYAMLSRKETEQTLARYGIQLSDCVSRDSIVEAGKLLGVPWVFSGFISKGKDGFFVTLDLYWVQTGEIEPVGRNDCPLCPEDNLIRSLEQAAAVFAQRREDARAETQPAVTLPAPAK